MAAVEASDEQRSVRPVVAVRRNCCQELKTKFSLSAAERGTNTYQSIFALTSALSSHVNNSIYGVSDTTLTTTCTSAAYPAHHESIFHMNNFNDSCDIEQISNELWELISETESY